MHFWSINSVNSEIIECCPTLWVIMPIYSQNIHWFMFLHKWQTLIESFTVLNHYCILSHEPIMNHQWKVTIKLNIQSSKNHHFTMNHHFSMTHELTTKAPPWVNHRGSPCSINPWGTPVPTPRNPPTRNRRCKSVEWEQLSGSGAHGVAQGLQLLGSA